MLKGGLLLCNMWSFGSQKAVFWKLMHNQLFYQRQQEALRLAKTGRITVGLHRNKFAPNGT